MLAQAERAGGKIVRPAARADWGGTSGAFADPDGYVWEVAHNPGWTITDDGPFVSDICSCGRSVPTAVPLATQQNRRPVVEVTQAAQIDSHSRSIRLTAFRQPVGLRHAYQSAPKNPAMSAANSSGASAAAKWPPRGMGVQRWMS